jgi:hypothetical protein
MALLDIDGDGRLDVALTGSGGIELFYQTSAGALASAGVVVPGVTGSLAADDVDSDGRTDLLVTNSGGIRWLRNLGDGSFETTTVTTDQSLDSAPGDLDGGGLHDVATWWSYDAIRIYRSGESGWTRTDYWPCELRPRSAAPARQGWCGWAAARRCRSAGRGLCAGAS